MCICMLTDQIKCSQNFSTILNNFVMSTNTPSSVKSNLWKLQVLKGLEFAWFPIPTLILFYQSHGLSFEQAVLLKSILSLSVFIFEIPSGYIADVLGRKKSLLAGGLIWTFSLIIYCWGKGFIVFAIAEVFSGLAASLISGADVAIAFDSLVQIGQEQNYRRLQGRLVAIAGATEAICGIIGAAVASFNLVYPFYLQTVFIVGYCVLVLTLVEPTPHTSATHITLQANIKELWRIVRLALIENKNLRWLIFLSANFGTATFLIVWLSQADMNERGFPTEAFGFAWAFFHLVMSLASLKASSLENCWGIKQVFLGLILLMGGSYIFLGVIEETWGIIFIAIIYLVRGFRTPLVLNHLNQHVSSSIRATVLSVNSFVSRLGFVLVGPMVGWLTDVYSLDVALIISGVGFIVVGLFCLQRLVVL